MNYDNKLAEKARPFAKMWSDYTNRKPVYVKRNKLLYCAIAIGIGKSFEELFEIVRNENADFVFVDGLSEQGTRARGLVCTEGDHSLATPEDCFFVGDVVENGVVRSIATPSRHVEEILGEDAAYLVCRLSLEKFDSAQKKEIDSFLDVVSEDF